MLGLGCVLSGIIAWACLLPPRLRHGQEDPYGGIPTGPSTAWERRSSASRAACTSRAAPRSAGAHAAVQCVDCHVGDGTPRAAARPRAPRRARTAAGRSSRPSEPEADPALRGRRGEHAADHAPDQERRRAPHGRQPRAQMRCLDGHDRIAHALLVPDRAIDQALTLGHVAHDLPFLEQPAVEILTAEHQGAVASAIPAGLLEHDRTHLADLAAVRAEDISEAGAVLADIHAVTRRRRAASAAIAPRRSGRPSPRSSVRIACRGAPARVRGSRAAAAPRAAPR